MNIEAYKKYWNGVGKALHTYSPASVNREKVDDNTFVFLTTGGLPSGAGPFLSFSEVQEDKLLTPNQVFRIEFAGLADYLMFRSNGSGDPICIDIAKQNEIVYLNHDNDFKRVFINESISQFALCLTQYRDFVLSLAGMTSVGYSRRKFSDEEFTHLKASFLSIDKRSLNDDSFWAVELEGLLWERDNE